MTKPATFFALGSLLVLALTIGGIAAIVLLADDEGIATAREVSGDAGFRAFVPKLQLALDDNDIEFIARRMQTTPVVCAAADIPSAIGGAQCNFVGENYDGFPVAYWRSEGTILPALTVLGQLATLLETEQPGASDDFGDGRVRVYALDLSPGKSHAIVTAMIARPPDFGEGGPIRVAIGTAWSFSDGRWRFTSMLQAYVSGEELLIPCQEALDFLGGAWERYPDPAASGPGPERCPFQTPAR